MRRRRPRRRRWLDRTSTDDMVLGAADLIFGVFSGLGLLPIAGVWTFPAMVWVVLFFIATGKEEMERRPTKVGFAVAVVLYVGVKILLLPGLFAGTPFSAPGASGVGGCCWALLVPALILLVALAAVYIYARRAERATIFVAYLVFALTDVVLTLVLYAPGFFGDLLDIAPDRRSARWIGPSSTCKCFPQPVEPDAKKASAVSALAFYRASARGAAEPKTFPSFAGQTRRAGRLPKS